MSYVISVEGGHPARVVAYDHNSFVTEITSVEDYVKLIGDQECYFSSTMDFPRDETRSKRVLALVEELHRASGRVR